MNKPTDKEEKEAPVVMSAENARHADHAYKMKQQSDNKFFARQDHTKGLHKKKFPPHTIK